MKEEKRRRQEETKADLDYSLKLKMKKKAKEVQQELALDMKLLEQMLTATTNEAMQSLQKKVSSSSLSLSLEYYYSRAREIALCIGFLPGRIKFLCLPRNIIQFSRTSLLCGHPWDVQLKMS